MVIISLINEKERWMASIRNCINTGPMRYALKGGKIFTHASRSFPQLRLEARK